MPAAIPKAAVVAYWLWKCNSNHTDLEETIVRAQKTPEHTNEVIYWLLVNIAIDNIETFPSRYHTFGEHFVTPGAPSNANNYVQCTLYNKPAEEEVCARKISLHAPKTECRNNFPEWSTGKLKRNPLEDAKDDATPPDWELNDKYAAMRGKEKGKFFGEIRKEPVCQYYKRMRNNTTHIQTSIAYKTRNGFTTAKFVLAYRSTPTTRRNREAAGENCLFFLLLAT